MPPAPGSSNHDAVSKRRRPPGVRACLLIGSENVTISMLERISSKGIHAFLAGTLTEAMRGASEDGYDVLVVDGQVYGKDTNDACGKLADAWPRAPIFVLSGPQYDGADLSTSGMAEVIPIDTPDRSSICNVVELLLEKFIATTDVSAYRTVLKAVLDNVSDGIVLTDNQGRYLFSNDAARKILTTAEQTDSDPSEMAEEEDSHSATPRELPLADAAGNRFGGLLHFSAAGADTAVRPFEPARDPSTGLIGADAFHQSLGRALARRQRRGDRCAVLLVDLDRIRAVRDTLGTSFADKIVTGLARSVSLGLRRGDLLARMARDEFALLVEGARDEQEMALIAEKLLALVRRAALEERIWPDMTASVGIAVAPHHGETPEALLEAADHALCQARAGGGNCFAFSTQESQQRVSRYVEVHESLEGALARKEFEVHYQPLVVLGTRSICGFEGLLRWQSPTLGRIAPAGFLPVLERTGMIQAVGEWVLHTACQQARRWQIRFGRSDIVMSINLSVRQLEDDSLVSVVRRALDDSGLPPACLQMEVTESLLMTEPERASNTLRRLAVLGVKVSIDDFGTGYSSLSYIKTLPVHGLKIDRSFLRGVPGEVRNVQVIRGTLALAHSLGLTVTAEGVETEAQLRCLERYRCDFAQGYLLGRPGSATEMAALLSDSGA